MDGGRGRRLLAHLMLRWRNMVAARPDGVVAAHRLPVIYLTLPKPDAMPCPRATLDDVDPAKVDGFLGLAQSRRGFALGPGTPVPVALTHLDRCRTSAATECVTRAGSR